jgi:protein-tyrosine phosphatase
MIDIHSHILPGIDDGSRSIDETLEMLREAEKAGFKEIITTPHYFEGYYEKDEETREQLINNVKAQMDIKKISVSLYVGNEIYITEDTMNNVKLRKASSLNSTKYVLVEFDLNARPMNMMNLIYRILKERCIPILAHPERYTAFQDDFSLISELSEMGVLMQCNLGSILGKYGRSARRMVRKMAKEDLIFTFGSDAHRVFQEGYFKKAEAKFTKIYGEEKMNELMVLNPRKLTK